MTYRAVTSMLAVVSLSIFVVATVQRGWSGPSSDFPSYYTAGRLVRAHAPLHNYYDLVWFQRQMHHAGIDNQLGGYIPQTPLTMAPFVPLSFFSPLTARRVWFVLNFFFLGISLQLISRMTKFSLAEIWLIAFLGYIALRSNFELGQYYIFLLALVTAATWLTLQKRDLVGGGILGAAIALKLYGAPLVLFAVCTRRWRLVWSVVAALALCAVCAITMFGWADILYYMADVLPRALKGETLNPYHPSIGSAATLLRRLFVAEAELNPKPWLDSPGTAAFLGALFSLGLIVFQSVGTVLGGTAVTGRVVAWWLIGMLLVSPNTASYTFVLLLLPVALLLNELQPRRWILVLAGYFLVTLPLWPAWNWMFPKVWLLGGLFLIAGWPFLRAIPRSVALTALGCCILVSGEISITTIRAAAGEPAQHFSRVGISPGSIYSGSPAPSSAGILYESIGPEKYVIRRGRQTFSFDGDAFHPSVPDASGVIYLELVNGARSKIVRFDEVTRESVSLPIHVPEPHQPAISHDGRSLAFESGGALYLFDGYATSRLSQDGYDASFVVGDREIVFSTQERLCSIRSIELRSGRIQTLIQESSDLASPSVSADRKYLLFAARRNANWQVWTKEILSGRETKITGGNCNNFSPVWDGSHQIVFSSDCRRGLGLPALYRATIQ